jgi:hypothetical protein
VAQQSVTIGEVLNPAQITVSIDDAIVWTNASTQVQMVTSDDGGATFATGPIQVRSDSLPVVFSNASAGVPYTCSAGLKGMVIVTRDPVSFARTIKPFFTDVDRQAMIDPVHTFGVITFDLWSPTDCRDNWDAINNAIASGSMPPPGDGSDGPWPQAKIDQFAGLFKAWKDGGFQI